jgi:hypothetical protein
MADHYLSWLLLVPERMMIQDGRTDGASRHWKSGIIEPVGPGSPKPLESEVMDLGYKNNAPIVVIKNPVRPKA